VGAHVAALAAVGQGVERIPQMRRAELQGDAALGRLVEAGDAIEDGGLAGAVRPDQRSDVAALGGEREVVHGDQAAEPHGQGLDAQDRVCHPCPSRTMEASMVLRSLSTPVGSGVLTRPRGFQAMISTMAKPNSSIRYCAGLKSDPKICLRKSSSRRISVPPMMTIAAIATPTLLPMPPSTTMARISADSPKFTDAGLMKPCRAVKNAPAIPPKKAPVAKAASLLLVVLMPSERHAISSSRSASHERPIGRRRRRPMITAASTKAPSRM